MGIVYFDNFWFKDFLQLYESYKIIDEKKSLVIQTTNFLNYLIKNDTHIQSLKYDGYFMELDNQKDLSLIEKAFLFNYFSISYIFIFRRTSELTRLSNTNVILV